MRSTKFLRRAVAGVLALSAGSALAADYHWNNPDSAVGGDFLTATNWRVGGIAPALPPGVADVVWLDLAGQNPLITLGASVTTTQLLVENSSPTLQLSTGATYTVTNPPASDPSLVVGGSSTAFLSFTGRLVSSDAVIGLTTSGAGIMSLEADALQVGSTWTSSAGVTVGKAGAGSLNLNDGSSLTCQQLSVGVASTASGYVSVGTNSMLTVSGLMTIGSSGQATLDIQDGARAKAGTAVFGLVAPASTSITADVNISGAGLPEGTNALDVTNGLYLGLNGTTYADIAGATLHAGSLAMGGSIAGSYQGTGSGFVTLTGSHLTVDTLLQVGADGLGELTLLSSGTPSLTPDVTSKTAVLGDMSPGALLPGTGFVTMNGGTSWVNTGDFTVALGAGSLGNLGLTQGGGTDTTQLTTGTAALPSKATIGYYGDGYVSVEDSGSVWTHHGSMYVGKMAGSSGTLVVSAGGKVETDSLYVASNGAADGGTGDVRVGSDLGTDGSPATLVVHNSAVIGGHGSGTLTVNSGGVVQVTGNLSLAAGSPFGSGTVTVTDTDSSLTVGGAVNVGVDSTGAITVQDGAKATTGNVFIGKGAFASGCTANVSNAANWTSTGGFYVGGDSTQPQGSGSLTVDNATLIAAGPITIWYTGVLISNDAKIEVPSVQLNGGIIGGQGNFLAPVHTTGGEFQIDPGLSLELTGALTSDADSTLSKSGAGTLVVSGPQSHGSGATFMVNEGQLKLLSDAGSPSSANLSVVVSAPGSLVLATTQHLAQLAVGAGATATVSKDAKATDATLIVHGLSIDTTGATPGALDLQDNDLIWAYGETSGAYDQVRDWISSGKAGHAGLMTGAGAGSSVALAPVPNTMLHVLSWNGQAISDGSDYSQVIVKYTYLGDVNLDGLVDSQDLYNVLAHLGQPGTWFDGDVNLDGLVTLVDYAMVLGNMNAGTGGASGNPLFTQWIVAADSPLAVPEPAALGVLAMAIGTLLARRRTPARA